jgi:TonB-linked outer membrane protein, SusC/RagA family
MKLTCVFLTAAILQVSAKGLSQNVTYSGTGVPLETIFKEVKKQTGYVFFYKENVLTGTKPVTISAQNMPLEQFLTTILAGQSLKYVIKSKSISISKIPRPPLVKSEKTIHTSPPVTVTGRVTDADGKGIMDVTVQVKGRQTSAITDVTGYYRIAVPDSNAALVFSHINYNTVDVRVNGRTTIDISLSPKNINLAEVIVLGYGQSTKRDLTGAVGNVKMEELQKAPVLSFDQALAGRIAGVQVMSDDGQPGSEGINIVIRGANSLTQSTAPLYVVDGFPLESPENLSINPEDIESISVLKDASATAIYGARGANGVIVIQTKRGKSGPPAVSITGTYGFQQVSNHMPVMSAYDFVRYQYENNDQVASDSYLSNGQKLEDYKRVPGIDWQKRLFRTAPMQVYNLSVRGGNDKTKYSFSGSMSNQEGIITNTGQHRYQGRIVLDQVLSKKVKTGINVNYSNYGNYGQMASASNSGSGASSYLLYSVWGYRPVTGRSVMGLPDEEEDLGGELLDEDIDHSLDYRVNPIISVENEYRRSVSNNLMANAYLEAKLFKGLEFRSSVGIEMLNRKNSDFYNSMTSKGTPRLPSNVRGQYGSIQNYERYNWLNENIVTWRRQFNRANKLEVLTGFTLQGTKVQRHGFMAQNVPNEKLGINGLEQGIPVSVATSRSDNKLSSLLGRVNYHLLSKYLFTVSFRADGSSKFAPQNQWAYFPSAAFAWRLGDERFMKKLRFISEAKMRMSYGVTGNNRVSDFATLPALNSSSSSYYSFGNATPSNGIYQSSLANPDLKWESTAQADFGLDLGFLNNRISLSVDVYRKTTNDLLLNADLPAQTGFQRVYKNIGKIRNDGLEFTLSTTNITTSSFSWETGFNISFNNNKVLGLAENQENLLSTVGWENSFNNVPLYIAALDHPAAMFYGYLSDGLYQVDDFDESASGAYTLKLTEPSNGMARYRIQPGHIRYKDVNADGVVDEKDRVVIGSVLPKHSGGLSNNFRYKAFSLHVFVQWVYGNNIYNANRMMFEGNVNNKTNLNQYASYNNRWTFENQHSKMYRVGGGGPAGYYSDYYIEDGSFMRLKTVSFTYSLPSRILKRTFFTRLEASVSAQNLYTWTGYSGMDPEVSVRNSTLTPGFDYSAYPRARTLVFGLKASF